MYSMHNEGKTVVTETFIRTLKNEIINTCIQYQKICILIN